MGRIRLLAVFVAMILPRHLGCWCELGGGAMVDETLWGAVTTASIASARIVALVNLYRIEGQAASTQDRASGERLSWSWCSPRPYALLMKGWSVPSGVSHPASHFHRGLPEAPRNLSQHVDACVAMCKASFSAPAQDRPEVTGAFGVRSVGRCQTPST